MSLTTGDPPLLTHYLQERLGITIKRKKTRGVVKLPVKVSTDPKWKVGCVLHCPPGFAIWKLVTSRIYLFFKKCIVGGRQNPEGVKEVTDDGYTSSCSGWEKWDDCQETSRLWRHERGRRHPPRKYRALLSDSGMNNVQFMSFFLFLPSFGKYKFNNLL